MKKFDVAAHDFDGIRACGNWIIAEQVGVRTKTDGGLAVPEAAQLAVWTVLTVGPEAKQCAVGDRILFMNPSGGTVSLGGRVYAILRDEQIIAVLQMPPEALIVPLEIKQPEEPSRLVTPDTKLARVH